VTALYKFDRGCLHCTGCGHEIPVRLPISVDALGIAGEAFGILHHFCSGPLACPQNDPECSQPADEPDDAPHCHDACEPPPSTLVELLIDRGQDLWEAGDAWQSREDVEDFLRALVDVASRAGVGVA
jgi:hypothetical protein